jgi:ElaB/YqjD/DUF883 family membrane-anchored ribosome-binding protein
METNKPNDINQTVDQVRAGVHSAVDKTANATVQAAETLSRKGKQLKTAEQQYMEQCLNYIHERPLTSLAIAAGAGFLLNRLLKAR